MLTIEITFEMCQKGVSVGFNLILDTMLGFDLGPFPSL